MTRSTKLRRTAPRRRGRPPGPPRPGSRMRGLGDEAAPTISAMPATRSAGGRSTGRRGRRARRPAGGTSDEVLLLGGVDPVFLPTVASTIARTSRRTWTTWTPRSQVAGDEPGEVGHRAATRRRRPRRSGRTRPAPARPKLRGHDGALGLLRVGDHGEVRVEPGRCARARPLPGPRPPASAGGRRGPAALNHRAVARRRRRPAGR